MREITQLSDCTITQSQITTHQSLNLQSPDQFFDVLNAMPGTPTFEVRNDALSCAGIEIACCANLDRSSAGEHEFHHVGCGGDSSHADHRNIDRVCRFIDHAERNRLDCRPGKPCSEV